MHLKGGGKIGRKDFGRWLLGPKKPGKNLRRKRRFWGEKEHGAGGGKDLSAKWGGKKMVSLVRSVIKLSGKEGYR